MGRYLLSFMVFLGTNIPSVVMAGTCQCKIDWSVKMTCVAPGSIRFQTPDQGKIVDSFPVWKKGTQFSAEKWMLTIDGSDITESELKENSLMEDSLMASINIDEYALPEGHSFENSEGLFDRLRDDFNILPQPRETAYRLPADEKGRTINRTNGMATLTVGKTENIEGSRCRIGRVKGISKCEQKCKDIAERIEADVPTRFVDKIAHYQGRCENLFLYTWGREFGDQPKAIVSNKCISSSITAR